MEFFELDTEVFSQGSGRVGDDAVRGPCLFELLGIVAASGTVAGLGAGAGVGSVFGRNCRGGRIWCVRDAFACAFTTLF